VNICIFEAFDLPFSISGWIVSMAKGLANLCFLAITAKC